MNHLGDQFVATSSNGKSHLGAGYRLNSGDRLKVVTGSRVVGFQKDSSLRTVAADEIFRRVDVDDPPVLHDGYPVAQSFSLFHQMGCQKYGLTSFADGAHQIPDGVPRLWVKPGGQLIEKYHFRIVD